MAEWYTHDHTPRAGPQPSPRELLWTLWQDGQRIDASLLIYQDGAIEMQLFCDAVFFSGTHCVNRASAVVLANKCFGDYLNLGWSVMDEE